MGVGVKMKTGGRGGVGVRCEDGPLGVNAQGPVFRGARASCCAAHHNCFVHAASRRKLAPHIDDI